MSTVLDAAPPPGFEWAGEPVEIGQIEAELRRGWREEANRAMREGTPLVTRTSVLNLIVRASSPEEVARVATAIQRLGVHHPSRTIIILAQPEEAEDHALRAWVKSHLLAQPGGTRRLRVEQVTIAAGGETARHLPGLVDPLLVSELPNFLWWLREPPFRTREFSRMTDLVDRLIVDSASFRDPARAFHELAELTVIPYGVAVSDFAWTRLRPWRELVAQFFDPPEQLPSLGAIEQVEVTYEPQGTDWYSGFSEGVLALGWACSRLGWHVQESPSREGPGAFRWRLRAGGRTIDAVLRPDHGPDGIVGLRRITLTAGDDYPGRFVVYREDPFHLATNVDVSGVPRLDRLMRATLLDGNDLLLHSLNQFGHDRVYDGALVFAAHLCRGLDERGS